MIHQNTKSEIATVVQMIKFILIGAFDVTTIYSANSFYTFLQQYNTHEKVDGEFFPNE